MLGSGDSPCGCNGFSVLWVQSYSTLNPKIKFTVKVSSISHHARQCSSPASLLQAGVRPIRPSHPIRPFADYILIIYSIALSLIQSTIDCIQRIYGRKARVRFLEVLHDQPVIGSLFTAGLPKCISRLNSRVQPAEKFLLVVEKFEDRFSGHPDPKREPVPQLSLHINILERLRYTGVHIDRGMDGYLQ
jgi:hypothetical protein